MCQLNPYNMIKSVKLASCNWNSHWFYAQSKTSAEGQSDWMPASAELLSAPSDPGFRLYTRTAVLRVHLGAPVNNSLDCLLPIFHLLFTSNSTVANSVVGGCPPPSLSLCCSFSDGSQHAINLLLIRLKRLSQKQEASLLCLKQGQNKGSNWQVNLTALPPTSLDLALSHNYHFAPTV